jgi:hypothetical protein
VDSNTPASAAIPKEQQSNDDHGGAKKRQHLGEGVITATTQEVEVGVRAHHVPLPTPLTHNSGILFIFYMRAMSKCTNV